MGDAPYSIRPIAENEFPAYCETLMESFGITRPGSRWDPARAITEFPRTLAAFDGGEVVGTAAVCSFEMTVPGGIRPVAGVTNVGVLPSHRRRGVLTSIMRRQLADLRDDGEAVAALFASEAGIYGRYGYGCAGHELALEIRQGETAYVSGAPTDARLRLRGADPHEVWPQLATVYDDQLTARPGQFARNGAWWNLRLHDPEQERDGFGPLRCVLAEDGTQTRGYALFAVRPGVTADGLPDGRLTLIELCALDPAAYAAVWSQVLGRDLIRTIHARRPVDDPIRHLLADPRRLRARLSDGLWIRLVDLERALAERSYCCAIDVVIEVRDPVCDWNTGRWQLTGDATGGQCERTLRPADIAIPVQILGAAYLGGVGLAGPAGAGLVRELRAGALDALSRSLSWEPAPWCPMVF